MQADAHVAQQIQSGYAVKQQATEMTDSADEFCCTCSHKWRDDPK